MNPLGESDRTFGLRVLAGGGSLAARVSLDFDQKLFRRNYRRPVLVAAAVAADGREAARWVAAGAARVFGHDLAARVLNRVAAEGAEPLYLQAMATGAAGTAGEEICRGLADVCFDADCEYLEQQESVLSPQSSGAETTEEETTEEETTSPSPYPPPSRERGEEEATAEEEKTATPSGKKHFTVAVVKQPPYMTETAVAVAVTAVVERGRMMELMRAEAGDVVLAVGGDRIWGDTLGAARKAMSTFKAGKTLPGLDYVPAQALIQPTPLLSVNLQQVLRRYTVKHVVHAMTPVEADGLGAAMERLVGGRFGMKAGRGRKFFSPLLELVDSCGGMPETADEGHRRGIAFLMVVSRPFAAAVAARMRRLGSPAWPVAVLGPVAREPMYRPPATNTSFLSRAKGFHNDDRLGKRQEAKDEDNEHRGKTIPPGHGD